MSVNPLGVPHRGHDMGVASGWQYGSETPPAVMIMNLTSSAGGSTHLKSLASRLLGHRLDGWPDLGAGCFLSAFSARAQLGC
jgi:hypothetical protein